MEEKEYLIKSINDIFQIKQKVPLTSMDIINIKKKRTESFRLPTLKLIYNHVVAIWGSE